MAHHMTGRNTQMRKGRRDMTIESIKVAFACIFEKISKNVDLLTELDQKSGDGDLGVSMKSGFKAASEFIRLSDETDAGRILSLTADVFNREAPSSLGTILSFFMKGMALSLKGKESFSLSELAAAMRAGIDSIMRKAGSKPGEKTILDSIFPAVEALQKHSNDHPQNAFEAAAEAASSGSEATRSMRAVWGRAAYYGEQSIGLLDGGSVVGKLIFEAINESCSLHP